MGKILDNPDEANVLHKSLKRRTFLSCGERRSLTVKERSERCDVAAGRGHCRTNACDFQKLEKRCGMDFPVKPARTCDS